MNESPPHSVEPVNYGQTAGEKIYIKQYNDVLVV
jgi:hypothetical protein